jgi:UDP-N-acetylglucosamine diphosphorylase / glucose-1-phosphate thymidylyltransferase / UDP-N-acetylgalactosamine diphosphorylase / glucosamine-1-phosphate N-acetyltransferase / galactosamine-1-phosphate N-acetyltransferase
MTLELYLFDDEIARSWDPLTSTRPAGELRFGAWTFRERAERFAGVRCCGHLAGGDLAGFDEPGCPPGRSLADVETRHARLFLNARSVPDPSVRFRTLERSGLVRIGDQPAGWFAIAGDANPDPDFLASAEPSAGTGSEHEGFLVDHVWNLLAGAADQIARDYEASSPLPASGLPAGVHVLGPTQGRLRIAQGVRIEPGVVLDTSGGPIWIERNAVVRAFTRLAGPAWVGAGATLLGGTFEAVVIGPVCKVHGEIEGSVFLGYSNKAHDGFIGHAYVGCWVNLGALTTNSDLKNNYGTVRVRTPDGERDTGLTKLGCMLGDHVKTGIGVMLNTGTVVGPGSNLFGARQPPRYVPPFRWGSGDEFIPYRFEKFIQTAQAVMARRDRQLTPGVRRILESLSRSAVD